MTLLTWDDTGDRFYETGVKKGVLYVRESDGTYPLGVAWNGLATVTESPSGAEANPIYADDVKYLNLISAEEFGATIEAYTYPDEFAECDGSVAPSPGVVIGQQRRSTFGLCYKTTLGNDVDENDYGYKLHLIYGAIAAPSEKAYASINESPEAITFSWELTTTPVAVSNQKPTACLTIDSTKVDSGVLEDLEDILYGTGGSDPYLPLPDAVIALFTGGAISAIALSSIAPTNGQGSQAITVNVVMTFNNAIKVEDIVLTTAAGVIVAVTRSWDADHKILTLDPNASLSAGTTYIVAIAGVVDIYNQALTASVKTFSTSA
jgi:hypothetical protein